jgi:putative transposon-encoded protein
MAISIIIRKLLNVPEEKKSKTTEIAPANQIRTQVKFEIYGEEMIEKTVKSSGNSGRVYLPPNWVGHHVKIIRID